MLATQLLGLCLTVQVRRPNMAIAFPFLCPRAEGAAAQGSGLSQALEWESAVVEGLQGSLSLGRLPCHLLSPISAVLTNASEAPLL